MPFLEVDRLYIGFKNLGPQTAMINPKGFCCIGIVLNAGKNFYSCLNCPHIESAGT